MPGCGAKACCGAVAWHEKQHICESLEQSSTPSRAPREFTAYVDKRWHMGVTHEVSR
jgi:hypothetical protein